MSFLSSGSTIGGNYKYIILRVNESRFLNGTISETLGLVLILSKTFFVV